MQWMYLRRSKRTLAMALLYLMAFYVCITVILVSLGAFNSPRGAALSAILFPTPLFVLDPASWNAQRDLWMLALNLQGLQVLLFAFLYHRRLREMAATTLTGDSATAASQ
jgi:hypothetical protein